MRDLAIWLASNFLLAISSILWSEVVRDLRHWLAHRYPWLMPKHVLHHQVFREDLSVVDPALYREVQWHHDVPEAITMVIAVAVPWAIALIWMPHVAWALFIGVVYSLIMLMASLIKANAWILSDHPRMDPFHQPGPFLTPPHPWLMSQAYHWRHHFDDCDAYFGGMFTLVDRLLGTSLSFKGKAIALTHPASPFGQALATVLQQQGANIISLDSPAAVKALTPVKILICHQTLDLDSNWQQLQQFLATIRSDADVACKEVWLCITRPCHSGSTSVKSLTVLLALHYPTPPCVIRTLGLPETADVAVAQRIVRLAKSDRRRINV